MSYLDFDLEIGQGSEGKYIITARSPAGEARIKVRFPFDAPTLEKTLLKMQIALLQSSDVHRKVLSPEQQLVQEFGQKLFDGILAGEVRSRYDVCRQLARQETGASGVRLRLSIQAPELAALPWEFLYDARQSEYLCLSRSTPLVRYLPLAQPAQPLTVKPPLRILCMIASPSDQDQLDIIREQQRIKSALDTLESQGLVQLYWIPGQTWNDLQQAMWRGPWHIFHFIGHGGFHPTLQEGVLALANEQGKSQLLSATQLARLLADHKHLRLALLNACDGAKGGEKDIFSSTAATLARGGVPAVLAMQYEISDRAAIQLTRTFYSALANGLPVDEAVSEVRKAISLDAAKTLEWATPVLFMHSPDGLLFNVAGRPTARGAAPAAAAPTPTPAAPADPGPTARAQKSKEDWLQEGDAYAQAKRFQEALAAYDAALRLDPTFARAYFGKGDALRLFGQPDEALKALDRAIELDPRSAAAYRRKAYILNQRQRHQEALTTLSIAIQLEPNYASAYIAKGDALKELKRYAEALTVYDQAIRLEPKQADPYIGKGDAQLELAHYQEALAAYDQALKLDPNNAKAQYGKSLVQQRLANVPPAAPAAPPPVSQYQPGTLAAPGPTPQPGSKYQPGAPGSQYVPGSAPQSPLASPPPPVYRGAIGVGQPAQAAPPAAPVAFAPAQRRSNSRLYLIIGGSVVGVLLLCGIIGLMYQTVTNGTGTIPTLHSSYSGSFTDLNGLGTNLILTNLQENRQTGAFTATATETGGCAATLTNGQVNGSHNINFTLNQTANPLKNCSPLTLNFSGQVNSDGSLSGSFSGSDSGTFTLT